MAWNVMPNYGDLTELLEINYSPVLIYPRIGYLCQAYPRKLSGEHAQSWL